MQLELFLLEIPDFFTAAFQNVSLLVHNVQNLGEIFWKLLHIWLYLIVGDVNFNDFADLFAHTNVEKYKTVDFALRLFILISSVCVVHEPKLLTNGQSFFGRLILIFIVVLVKDFDDWYVLNAAIFWNLFIWEWQTAMNKIANLFLFTIFGFETVKLAVTKCEAKQFT